MRGKKVCLCQLGSVDQAWSAVMDDLVQSFFGSPSHCDVSLLCEHAHCHTVPALFALFLFPFRLPDWPLQLMRRARPWRSSAAGSHGTTVQGARTNVA